MAIMKDNIFQTKAALCIESWIESDIIHSLGGSCSKHGGANLM